MNFYEPDYSRSLLSVTASIMKHYGVTDCAHATLPELDTLLKKEPENVVLILCDGMGTAQLARHLGPEDFLRRHLVCPISTVFPPTTTAATTTVLSGLSPLEHSWLGWDLYFRELDQNVTAFLGVIQDTDIPAAEYNAAFTLLPYKSIFQRIREAAPDVQTHYISEFGDEKCRRFKEKTERVRLACRAEGRSFSYVYCDEPDHCMHFKGVGDAAVTARIRELNDEIEALCRDVEDTLVLVVADHGLVDVRWEYFKDRPALAAMLKRPPSMEPRALSLFVKDGRQEEFARAFRQEFGEEMLLLTREQVYEKHLFGFGTPGGHTDGFIGDFIALSRSELCLGWEKNKDVLKANHAGLSAEELYVPLIAKQC